MESANEDMDRRAWAMEHLVGTAIGAAFRSVDSVTEAIRAWRVRRGLEKELAPLDESALADIGLTRGQVPVVVQAYPIAPRLLRRMMERLGIDDSLVNALPGGLVELQRNCVMCSARNLCKRWLRSPTPAAGYRAFCPNAASFDGLLRNPAARAG